MTALNEEKEGPRLRKVFRAVALVHCPLSGPGLLTSNSFLYFACRWALGQTIPFSFPRTGAAPRWRFVDTYALVARWILCSHDAWTDNKDDGLFTVDTLYFSRRSVDG